MVETIEVKEHKMKIGNDKKDPNYEIKLTRKVEDGEEKTERYASDLTAADKIIKSAKKEGWEVDKIKEIREDD